MNNYTLCLLRGCSYQSISPYAGYCALRDKNDMIGKFASDGLRLVRRCNVL